MEKLEKQKNDFKQKYMNALSEVKELKEKLQQAQDQVTKLADEIKDHKTDNENWLAKIKRLSEGRYITRGLVDLSISLELTEIRKNKDKIVEDSTNIDATIQKFKEFWDFILMEHETVLSNLDKNIPNFKALFSKLNADEKARFKPILQIVAHSLQFLKKIMTLDQSYNFLQKDYKKFVSTTNQSFDQISENDKNKAEMLEQQLVIMQNECVKLREKEAAAKAQVRQLEQELKATENIAELKREKLQLEEELEELRERFQNLVKENEKCKSQISNQLNQLRDNDKLIENMNKKIMNSIDTETQLDEMRTKTEK